MDDRKTTYRHICVSCLVKLFYPQSCCISEEALMKRFSIASLVAPHSRAHSDYHRSILLQKVQAERIEIKIIASELDQD